MEECVGCGERWLRWDVATRLQELVDAMLAADIEVGIRRFSASVTPSGR